MAECLDDIYTKEKVPSGLNVIRTLVCTFYIDGWFAQTFEDPNSIFQSNVI